MRVASLSFLVLRYADLERAKNFYASLGFELAKERHGQGPVHYAFQAGAILIELYPLPPGAASGSDGLQLGFEVDSLDAAAHAASTFGGVIETPPVSSSRGRRAVVVDPGGHRLELLQPV